VVGSDAPSEFSKVKTPHLQQAFASNHSAHLARGELPSKPSARRPHRVASAVVWRVYRKWISPRESRGRGDVIGHSRPCHLALFRGDHRPGGNPVRMSPRTVPVFGRNSSHPKVVIPRKNRCEPMIDERAALTSRLRGGILQAPTGSVGLLAGSATGQAAKVCPVFTFRHPPSLFDGAPVSGRTSARP
jgi:hypothetical protein